MATLCLRKRQALIDARLRPGAKTTFAEGLSNLGYTERVACRIADVSRSCCYEYKPVA